MFPLAASAAAVAPAPTVTVYVVEPSGIIVIGVSVELLRPEVSEAKELR
jgi:hypothetical protein